MKTTFLWRVLLEELPNCTVITVAHRLSNITHFHRVLVIGKLLGLLQYLHTKLINF
jgi:ABC-type bacteriocin/lantibiotic exporter with double-glycine peptidase domain